MIINPSDVKVPLKKVVTTIGGNFEVSLSKRSESDSLAYQEFVASYVTEVESSTIEEAAAQFISYESVILEESESAELTPAQKKLPPAVQKALLKKMSKNHPDAENKKEQKGETKDSEKEEEAKAKCATKTKAQMQMVDEESGEPLDDETEEGDECGMKAKKAKAAKKPHADEENKKEQKGETKKDEKMEDVKASGQKAQMLSKKDQVDTCPTCESLNVNKAADAAKKVCATCKK